MTDTAIATSARPPLSLTFGSLLRADLTVLVRSWRSLMFSIILPLVPLIITAFETSSSIAGAGIDAAAILIGVSITFGLLSSDLMGYSLGIARDRENGVFQRLRVTPAPTWTIMVSRLLTHLIVNVILTLVVTTIGAIVHGITLGIAQYLLLIPASLIAGAVFLSIGQALVGLLNTSTLVAAVGRFVFIALVLAGLLGVTGVLGDGFKTFSQWTPIGATVQLFHTAIALTGWTVTDTGAVLACLGYIAIFGFLGIRFFRWNAR